LTLVYLNLTTESLAI